MHKYKTNEKGQRICVLGIYMQSPSKVLLLKKSSNDAKYPDHWVLPGGHMDIDDQSLQEAMTREWKEETGTDVYEVDEAGGGWWNPTFIADGRVITVFRVIPAVPFESRIKLSSEHTDYMFLDLSRPLPKRLKMGKSTRKILSQL